MSAVRDTATPVLRSLSLDMSGSYLVTIGLSANTKGRTANTRSFDGASTREATNLEKLTNLAAQGRDFVKVTDEMLARVVTDLDKALAALLARDLPTAGAFKAIGKSVRKHIVWRFANTGPHGPPDVPMRALSPPWIKHKGHANVGIYNRHLSEAFAEASVETTRI